MNHQDRAPEPQDNAPELTDDFKQINGIGPAIERRLHNAGILTFADLASLTVPEILELIPDANLSSERISQQNWTGQAALLATAPGQGAEQASDHAADRQHYQTFTLQFLLDEKNTIRRTQMTHVQSGEKQTWPGYDGERLLTALEASIRPVAQSGLGEAGPPAAAPDSAPSLTSVSEGEVQPAVFGGTTLTLRSAPDSLRVGERSALWLSLDFGRAQAPGEKPPEYQYYAHISGKPLYGGARRTIGTSAGSLTAQGTAMIEVFTTPGPPAGLYHLEGVISLRNPASGQPYGVLPMREGSVFDIREAS